MMLSATDVLDTSLELFLAQLVKLKPNKTAEVKVIIYFIHNSPYLNKILHTFTIITYSVYICNHLNS